MGSRSRLEIAEGYYGGTGKWTGREEAPHRGRPPEKLIAINHRRSDFNLQNLNYNSVPTAQDINDIKDMKGRTLRPERTAMGRYRA